MSVALMERLLSLPSVHTVIELGDMCVDISSNGSGQSLQERRQLLTKGRLPPRVLYARLDSLLDRRSDLYRKSNLTRLRILDVTEDGQLVLGESILQHRRCLQKIVGMVGPHLTTVRLLGYPTFISMGESCVPYIVSLLKASSNVQMVDISANFVAAAMRHGQLEEVIFGMDQVVVVRLVTTHR